MADEKKGVKGDKKGDKKKAPPPPGVFDDIFKNPITLFIALVLIIFAVERVWNFLGSFVSNRGYATTSDFFNNILSNLFYKAETGILYFTIISNILSVIFIMIIIYSVIRIWEIRSEEDRRLREAETRGTVAAENVQSRENEQWARVSDHINSENPGDWRMAILEADIMLDKLLDKIGCMGNTVGDKLKQVNKGDLKSLDLAWEAHRVRNSIAHEGTEFTLQAREAKRVIALYERVFREFHYI